MIAPLKDVAVRALSRSPWFFISTLFGLSLVALVTVYLVTANAYGLNFRWPNGFVFELKPPPR